MLTIIKKNDTYDVIEYQLENEDGTIADLTGASVNFVMGKKNKLITNSAANITSAINGIVQYQLTEVDTLVSGTFLGEFVVTFANGTQKTYPSNGYITVDIEQNLDTSQNNIVLDMIAEKQGEFTDKLNSILQQAGNVNMSYVNEYNWMSTNGQVTYVFPVTANYTAASAKWFQVFVGNVFVDNSLVNRIYDDQFTLSIDPSRITDGVTVTARWIEPIAPIVPSSYKVIPQQDIPPIDAEEGDLWFDTSDDTYQGTVFSGLNTRVTNAETSLAEKTSDLQQRAINIMYPPAPLVGLKADGTDETTLLQNLINSLGTTNVNLFAPKGTYRVQGVTINSYIGIMGAGVENTIFKLVDGSTKDVFITNNFSSLTNTGGSGGVVGVRLAHLQIDGNKVNCPSGGWCLKRFGYRWDVDTIKVINGNSGGIYSEWGTFSGYGLDGDYMEDEWRNLRVHHCNNYGVQWRGSHDSRFNNTLVYSITGVGVSIETSGNYSSGGVVLNHIHVYGCTGNGIVSTASLFGTTIESESNGGHGIILQGKSSLMGVIVFNNTGDGLQLISNDSIVDGLHTYNNTGNGFTLGASGLAIAGSYVTGKSYANTANQINLVNDNGANKISLHVYTSDGTRLVTGTVNPNSLLEVVHSSAVRTSGTTAQRPFTNIYGGRLYYDTTLNKPMFYNGSSWVDGTGSIGNIYSSTTIGSGSTSTTVTHGLGGFPNFINITPWGNLGNVWVSNVSGTQFTVNCSVAPASSTVVAWHARV